MDHPLVSTQLEVIRSAEPAVSFVTDEQVHTVINLAGEFFDDNTTSQVVTHAIEVHQAEASIRANARKLCVALFRCKTAYMSGRENERKTGWVEFCARNFAVLGLSDSGLRAAVRTGKALALHEDKYPAGIEVFDHLSRAALFVLGGNEATLVSVQQALEKSPEMSMTADEIRKLIETLNQEKVLRLETEQRLGVVQQANLDLAESAAQRREQATRWRERAETAETAAKTPVEAVVFKLPPGVKSEEDLREKLQQENAKLKTNNEQLKSSVETNTEKLKEVRSNLQSSEQTKNVLEDLDSDLHLMIAKFPRALTERMGSGTPAVKQQLKDIAKNLRALASAIDVD